MKEDLILVTKNNIKKTPKTGGLLDQSKVFSGGGEMGKFMRSFDWAKTAVGPVDS
jgi:hypothetical protein